MNGRATRMRLPALALFAIAGLLPGAANAAIPGGPGGDTPRAYPSHVIGAGTSQWNGQALPGTVTLGGSADKDLARTLLTGFHRKSVMRSFRPVFFDKPNLSAEEKELAERKLWSAVTHIRELMDAQKKP